jgi:hypothetical protein
MADLTPLEMLLTLKHLGSELRAAADITRRMMSRSDVLLHTSSDAEADFLVLEVRTELRISQSLALIKRSRQVTVELTRQND